MEKRCALCTCPTEWCLQQQKTGNNANAHASELVKKCLVISYMDDNTNNSNVLSIYHLPGTLLSDTGCVVQEKRQALCESRQA